MNNFLLRLMRKTNIGSTFYSTLIELQLLFRMYGVREELTGSFHPEESHLFQLCQSLGIGEVFLTAAQLSL